MGENSSKNSYKDTLNLPQTDFDMRAGLLKKEPAIQQQWKEDGLYEKIRDARDGSERFILHDGPPYANGNIHMGTALNKVLKDMVIRTKNMAGLDAPYLPGWDCHGLPIEAKVMDELGEKARQMDPMDIRSRCAEYAGGFVDKQSEQFQRLGVMGHFADPYITMAPRYESATLEVFAKLVEQGIVYRQLKPVHWSIENRTALADAELEYHDREDSSIYVGFEIVEGGDSLPSVAGDTQALMIWTTTPWTLPANLAAAVSPEFQYAAVHAETADGNFTWYLAEKRAAVVIDAIQSKRDGWLRSYKPLGTLSGLELIEAGVKYRQPLKPETLCPVVAADYVTLEDGTGIVHTAPGHGLEDYGTAMKIGLDVYCPVRPDGTFDETAPPWLVGKTVWQANPAVIEHLTGNGRLVLSETISHSYPHDWRSKTPTIFRATEQWFIAVDKPVGDRDQSLRQMALQATSKDADDGGIDFVPNWGRNRMAGMLESRPDWCISRQRAWGLPIPAFFNENGDTLLTPSSVRCVARCFAEKGSDAWFTLSPAEILADYDPADDPDLDDASAFDPAGLRAARDIFDVWFESGSSWFAVAIQRGLADTIPVEMYLEGSDQHRGWFQLSLLPALGAHQRPPFQTVLTHGFVVTEDGYKMSKSLGNVIDVIEQLSKRGADILRLWIASQNYQDDIRCSEELIGQAEDAYRKIRNTLRFMMGNLYDFDPAVNAQDPADHSIDLWMRLELQVLIREVRQAYDRYEFHRATRLLYEFCTVQASSIYMSAVKDRLYCEAPDAVRRRASQTVLYEMLVTMVKLLAPILPHTCEEAWANIPNRTDDEPESVHLAALPEFDEEAIELAEDLRPVNPDDGTATTDVLQAGPGIIWDALLDLRDEGLNKLEALRNAGVKNSLNAEAVFRVPAGDRGAAELVETYLHELEDLLGVGYARIESAEGIDRIDVAVADSRQKYPLCQRSRKRRPDVGEVEGYPDVSKRDAYVLQELGE
ncbi:MAG: isoleucine--tRNA ligase [Planctomycetota bacterium]